MLVDGKEVIVRGRLVKIAELKEEWDENIHDPEAYVEQLKRSSVRAQIFSFVQRFPSHRKCSASGGPARFSGSDHR